MIQPVEHPERRLKREDPTPARLWSLIAGAAVAVLVAAGVGYYVFLFVLDTYKLVPSEAARTAVTLIGVPTAAGAVFVALRNLRLKEKQLHTDQLRLADAAATYDLAFDSEYERRRVDQERELRSRYVSAADQIGNESAAVRLAGVNAMAELANDWSEQRQACVDVLCAYLRLPQLRDAEGNLSAADGEVRRTVQRLIAQGFRRSKSSDSARRWPDLELDLRGAVLVDCHMPRVAARKASFIDTEFHGSTTFIGSVFQDATFRGAHFTKAVTFSNCEFRRVHFFGTTFMGPVRFKRAVFFGMINFADVRFASNLDLSDVNSKRSIQFQNTSFIQHPQYEAEGYKVILRNCNINSDPIPDLNVKVRPLPGGDDELDYYENLEEDEYFQA